MAPIATTPRRRGRSGSGAGRALVEFILAAPLLLILTLGSVEFSNLFQAASTLSHVVREAGSVLSRESGDIGSSAWASSVNSDLVTVLDAATPVINRTGSGATGPNQFKMYYSQIEWDAAQPTCDYNRDRTLGTSCQGTIGGQADRYRIRRANDGWTGSVVWSYGALSDQSRVGVDGDCACKSLPQVKQLSTQGLTLHVIELIYDYQPLRSTALRNFLGNTITRVYRRSVFLDRS